MSREEYQPERNKKVDPTTLFIRLCVVGERILVVEFLIIILPFIC